MRLFHKAILFFLFSPLASQSPAQSSHSIEAEVRAVWITTALGLDWPRTQDANKQRSSLIGIVKTLKQHNFNTIFFQVRAKGDAYYRSSYEPWAENLTGVPDKNPGYDPLALLLKEAHEQGMEVHAWFNLYKVGKPRLAPGAKDRHVSREHPDWTYEYDEGVWLNPGIPEVNSYLVRVAMDLVRRYAIDGIQFDFIRYPGRHVPDRNEYRKFGNGMDIADWRRQNIDRFVAEVYDSITLAKPAVKVGATPVGNFDESGRPSGFAEFYQNSAGWMRNGTLDYLAPQIYWSLGHSPADPDFAVLARQWASVASGRHVYAGLAPYKPEVLRELGRQVDSARTSGCRGQAFFRFESMGDFSALRYRYEQPASIPTMPWKQQNPPGSPLRLAATEVSPGIYHLEWTPVNGAVSYRLYRSTSPSFDRDGPPAFLAATGDGVTFFVDSVGFSEGVSQHYAVTSVDRFNRESTWSPVVATTPRGLQELREIVTLPVALSASIDTDDTSRILIGYSLPESTRVSITLQQDARQTTNPLLLNLVGEVKPAGTHVFGVDRTELPPGDYFVVLRAGGMTINRRLVLDPL